MLLTDYHTQQSAMLTDLIADYKIDCLYLPRTTDADDLGTQVRLGELAAAHGVDVVLYDYGEAIEWCDGTTLTVHRTDLARSEQPVLLITLQKGDAQICMQSATAEHTELAAKVENALANADQIIIPERGPKPRLPYSLAAAHGADVTFATRALASFCDPMSLGGVQHMTVCPEIAYFTIATKQN